jgi:hypothetical protein
VYYSYADDWYSGRLSGTFAPIGRPFDMVINSDKFEDSKWPGHLVKLTVTLHPGTVDGDPSDDKASVTVQVPKEKPTALGTGKLTSVPC